MKRLLLASAGALLVCSCGGAKEVKPTPGWAEGKKVEQGEVIALSDQHLALFDPRHPEADGLTLRVTPATTFLAGGREVHRGDIEEGTPVRVFFEPGGEQPLATKVEVIEREPVEPVEPEPE